MSRRSFGAALNRSIRAAERSHRARLRAQAAYTREVVREHKLMEKADRERYLGNRAAEVDEDNARLVHMQTSLDQLLAVSLHRRLEVDFSSLRQVFAEADLDERPELILGKKPELESFLPLPLGFFNKLFSASVRKYQEETALAHRSYEETVKACEAIKERRAIAKSEMTAEIAAHNREVDTLSETLIQGKPEAISRYAELVLDASEYPEGFPQDFKVAYVEDSKQLVIEYQLPRIGDIISEFESFKYVKSGDRITEKKRPEKVRSASYAIAIAMTTLRTLHEIFSADRLKPVQVLVFNGIVHTVDPATGHPITPCLISVRAIREKFESLQLGSVDPVACLKSLNAAVSRSPKDLVAVKPILEFDMVDPRYVTEEDILSTLDTRPNLMELTPGEFESLITNLFQSMGLETKLTQASRDGGVDCVAYDSRPILGGKVVVQAKRYRHTVGVSAVRDLFGTMHNEGASKGILVTTSGFGSAAFAFANGKPIELINGSNLLYLLDEHAGVKAKIEVPSDWVDLPMDIAEIDPVEMPLAP